MVFLSVRLVVWVVGVTYTKLLGNWIILWVKEETNHYILDYIIIIVWGDGSTGSNGNKTYIQLGQVVRSRIGKGATVFWSTPIPFSGHGDWMREIVLYVWKMYITYKNLMLTIFGVWRHITLIWNKMISPNILTNWNNAVVKGFFK